MTDERRALAKKLRNETGLGIMNVINALRTEQEAREYMKEHVVYFRYEKGALDGSLSCQPRCTVAKLVGRVFQKPRTSSFRSFARLV